VKTPHIDNYFTRYDPQLALLEKRGESSRTISEMFVNDVNDENPGTRNDTRQTDGVLSLWPRLET